MVDLQPKSKKLVERGIRLIHELGNVPPAEARRLFKTAERRVKTAIVMARKNIPRSAAARHALPKAGGFLREGAPMKLKPEQEQQAISVMKTLKLFAGCSENQLKTIAARMELQPSNT